LAKWLVGMLTHSST